MGKYYTAYAASEKLKGKVSADNLRKMALRGELPGTIITRSHRANYKNFQIPEEALQILINNLNQTC